LLRFIVYWENDQGVLKIVQTLGELHPLKKTKFPQFQDFSDTPYNFEEFSKVKEVFDKVTLLFSVKLSSFTLISSVFGVGILFSISHSSLDDVQYFIATDLLKKRYSIWNNLTFLSNIVHATQLDDNLLFFQYWVV
jgi:hypothetical protein